MKKRVFNFIKQLIINTLATTTMSIVLTSVASLFAGGTYMGFTVPLEILLANFLAHIGFIVFNKIDMKYKILNYIVMFALSTKFLLLSCGRLRTRPMKAESNILRKIACARPKMQKI